jgi:hypothetical protein
MGGGVCDLRIAFEFVQMGFQGDFLITFLMTYKEKSHNIPGMNPLDPKFLRFSYRICYNMKLTTEKVKESCDVHRNSTHCMSKIKQILKGEMIDYLGFYVPLKNFSLVWRRHHCR